MFTTTTNESSPVNQEQNKPGGYTSLAIPPITLPKGGGAIKSIDEKFSVNAVNGTAGLAIPFPFSPSRNGFMPSLSLRYDSGSGNGIFGLGWSAELPAIVRKTDKKLPTYRDDHDEDVFLFSGAEDLVPVFHKDVNGEWVKDSVAINGQTITRYRPRIEAGFAKIEKITEADNGSWWKVTSAANVVTVFGKSPSARIQDPAHPQQIFKWLAEFSYDDKGNCFQYVYKQEDALHVEAALHEKNRFNGTAAFTNTYLKSVRYGNTTHFNHATIDWNNWENFLSSIDYLLQLVLDYGEHDWLDPQPDDNNSWACRADAFSDYRAGFDLRTYRLCKRLLMFHHFPELGATPCLVRASEMTYEAGAAFTFLTAVTQKGFIRQADGSYSVKSLPPAQFTYEPLGWDTTIHTLPDSGLENLPAGIDDTVYRFIDLYKEGVAGILTEQANAWYYKSNEGNGEFGNIQLVSPKPALEGISGGALQFQDLEAGGQQFLVSYDLHGYFELGDDNQWLPFKNFQAVPNIDLHDPNLKFIDLDGDGVADILVSEEQVFTWYGAKGTAGFDRHRQTPRLPDEERSPCLVFADHRETILLADMNGDGLSDIVRIRNSEVSYWPNQGYGQFGARINMSQAPVFDHPDNFNPQFIKLADLDGSGTTDLVYLGNDSFTIYFNQSGNSFSKANVVQGVNPLPFPKTDGQTAVQVIDLLGNGTSCIVWSSALPQFAGAQVRYIDLMGGKKPHILTGYKNNMGKEVQIEYKPSTFFYLEDKKSGNPWVTKLPFPVYCVSQVVMIDQVRKSRFTNQYTYHHGYYDHHEREFRGFGRVDQTDTERFELYKKHSLPGGGAQVVDEGLFEPPVLTKTWYHTGAFLDKEKILHQFEHEYYHNEITPEQLVQEPPIDAELTGEEWREALRAFKGLPLRVEVYTKDDSDKAQLPYNTASNSSMLHMLQPRLQNRFAVFNVQSCESLAYTYERNPADPRISHNMTLQIDEFGNVLRSAVIGYGRRTADASLTPDEQAEQARTHIVFSENKFTNKIEEAIAYHLPVLYESTTWHLTGLTPSTGNYFTRTEINNACDGAAVIAYEATPATNTTQKRLIEQVRALFLKNDLSGALPAGVIESLALPYQSYKLALTPGLRDDIFGNKVSDALLLNEGRYVHLNDDNYWIPSGTQIFDATHFYKVTAMTDPFGNQTLIEYDANYCFFVQRITDALGNKSDIEGFNFRTLAPYLLRDANDNRSGVRTDELGMVISTFIMGKVNEQVGDLMDTGSVEATATDQPGSMLEYDLFNYLNTGKPNFSKASVREKHYYDNLASGEPVVWKTAYTYVCGGGKPAMQKAQAEPGIALQENADGTVTEVDTTPNLRWIGNGRTIFNNKGKPVKQYEPYFSTSFAFEDAKELVERGVTPIMHYDEAGRLIRTDLPDGTFTTVAFDAWMQRAFDQNDTVLDSQWYKDRIITPVPATATPEEIDAANKAAAHANTPVVAHQDSLGRTFLSIADNATAGKHKTRPVTDIEGNLRTTIDARGNMVMQFKYDMLGARLYQQGIDTGERWMINDVMGKPIQTWDSRDHRFRYEYDALHRPVKAFVQTGSATETNFERFEYGEAAPDALTLNLRNKLFRHYDNAGIAAYQAFDFKGNLLQSNRQLCKEYKQTIDWNSNPAMEPAAFTASFLFDALNRAIQITAPDESTVFPVYNEGNSLQKIEVRLNGEAGKTTFVGDIQYNAKRQRLKIVYGNNTVTRYSYHASTFRLIELLTTGKNGTYLLQQLKYTFDPSGNITTVKDEAQQEIFFNNTVVDAGCTYTYDALYQLIAAGGREHVGQNQPPGAYDEFRTNLPMPGDGAAMRNYTQQYEYDEVGNIKKMIHAAGAGSWTRTYDYATNSNRLLSNTVNNITENCSYDAHGNIQGLMHIPQLIWNEKDQLQQVDLGGGGTAYYVYDANGQRVRKIIERQGGIKEERIYIGSFELFRKTNSAGDVVEETATLHIMDDTKRVAMVETKTGQPRLIRYQYSNYTGSSSLELDENATIISYEEYHPYGTTAYQAMNASIQAAAKQYRYTGMERDEETGLEYHGARYYLPWLARWLSADPIMIAGGLNVYAYSGNNPVVRTDRAGTDDKEEQIQWAKDSEANDDRHDRLMRLLPIINGHVYYPKGRIEEKLQMFGDDKILAHYGYTGPDDHTMMGYQKNVIAAITKYDNHYLRIHALDGTRAGPVTKEFVEGQKRERNWQYGMEGYGYVTSSVTAGAFASFARVLTDDPQKIAGAAGFGSALAGAAGAYGQAYADKSNMPVLHASEPEITLVKEPLEGSAPMGPRNKFRPRSEAIEQETEYTCASASCRMVLDDLGYRGIPESRIAVVLDTTPDGASVLNIPEGIRRLDIPVGRNNLITSVNSAWIDKGAKGISNIETALNNGNKVIASLLVPGVGPHAVVVDIVTPTTVVIRDPGVGQTVVMPRTQFQNQFTGRMAQFVLKKK